MKETEKLSVLFLLKSAKKNGEGKIPITVRITVRGTKRAEISLSKTIDPVMWDQEANRATGKTHEATLINQAIDKTRSGIKRSFDILESQGILINSALVKASYLGKTTEEKKPEDKTILFTISHMIAKFEEKVKKEQYSNGTLKRWKILKNKLEAFILHDYKKNDLPLKDIRFAFAEDFLDYLTLTDPNEIGQNTAMKYVKTTKQVFKKAVERGWLEINPIQEFICTYDQPERESLTMQELNNLWTKDMVQRLGYVRDVFVFCCFTGFAYSDVYNLTPDDIYVGLDGKRWIVKDRQKTDSPERVPLLPIAEQIIAKYKRDKFCQAFNKLLPVNSNQRYNGYLKEIDTICEIGKNLTTHIARHTFATTVTLEHDVPLETVSKMLGHRSIRTTQVYAKVTQRKVSNNMLELIPKIFTDDGQLMIEESSEQTGENTEQKTA